MNSIYFYKEQKELVHKLIDLLLEYNRTIPKCDSWDNYFRILIRNEDDGIIVEFADSIECEGFTYVDCNHMTVQDHFNPIWLDIDEDAYYTVPMGEFAHNYQISGVKLREFIDKEYKKEKE